MLPLNNKVEKVNTYSYTHTSCGYYICKKANEHQPETTKKTYYKERGE